MEGKKGDMLQKSMKFTTLVALWAFAGVYVLLLFSLNGCTVGPDFVRPDAPSVDRYTRDPGLVATSAADGKTQHFEQGGKIAADWWRLFNSPKLNDVITEALANNLNLQAAQASLRQSQENLSAGYGVFYPQIDAGFGAARQKFSSARFGGSSTSSIFNLYTLAATVSYTLDIFGGERRTVESLGAQVDFQRYTVEGTYLTLTSNIINTIISRSAYLEEINATEELINLQREQVDITAAQAEAGTAPYSNVLSLQSQLAATEATLPLFRQKLSQADHLLAILAGRTPAEWTPAEIRLSDITLPEELPISLPSELVRHRPDILASEAQLHNASAVVGVATAALFPSFTLSGSYGFENTSISSLIKKTSSVWDFGANVAAPIFRGGTLSAERRAAIEAYNQSLAIYRQNVLEALAQVADTLRALEHDADFLKAASKALSTSEEALQLIQSNYQSGTVNYVQVLIANSLYHQAKIGHIQAQAQRLQDTVALFVALGGGWWNEEVENVQASSSP